MAQRKKIRIRKSAVHGIIGDAIRNARERQELSVPHMEALTGLKQKELESIEAGKTNVCVLDLYRIAYALQAPPRAFMPSGDEIRSWQPPSTQEPEPASTDTVEIEGKMDDG